MIGIVNIGPAEGETSPIGKHCYEVRINRQLITTFHHYRANGLAECLRLAAEAVSRHRDQELVRLLEEVQQESQQKPQPHPNKRRHGRS